MMMMMTVASAEKELIRIQETRFLALCKQQAFPLFICVGPHAPPIQWHSLPAQHSARPILPSRFSPAAACAAGGSNNE